MTDEPKVSKNGDMPPEIERLRKLVAARFNQQATKKAIWQRRVRGYLVRALADMRQLKRPPRQSGIAIAARSIAVSGSPVSAKSVQSVQHSRR